MKYVLKPITSELLSEALRVEKGAMGEHCYLSEVYDYFAGTNGELTCVFADDEMVGIGKLTVLWDRSAWLETLRVAPEWQRKGVGFAIYGRYFEQLRELKCPSVAMYTGASNVSSAALARRFGLEKAASFREYSLSPASNGDMHGFERIGAQEAAALIRPYYERYNNYAVMNRTYYRLNDDTCCGLANEGRVWFERKSASLLVAGARFQTSRGIHIAMLEGDASRCLDCARALAFAQNAPKIVCNFALENAQLEDFLKKSGFTAFHEDFITMEAQL